MPGTNRTIIIAAVIITSAGIFTFWNNQTPPGTKTTLSRIIIGGYMLALIASIVELFGRPVAWLTNSVLMLAVMTVILAVAPAALAAIGLGIQHGGEGQVTRPTEGKK